MTGQPGRAREHDIVATMARLADTLVAGFDQLELLRDLSESCTRILDADAAGVSVATDRTLRFVVATREDDMELIELLELDHTDGPSLEAFRRRVHVASGDITESVDRWPRWAPRALELGFRAVDAFPMRLRDDAVGALNVYATRPRRLDDRDVAVGTALADIATTGILQARAIADQAHVTAQLQHALASRVVVEQAKGVIAERDRVDPATAFERLRHQARSTSTSLTELAHAVVSGEVELPARA